jgi:tRNA threonylcarbamoyl adenosine modification protein YeaZ
VKLLAIDTTGPTSLVLCEGSRVLGEVVRPDTHPPTDAVFSVLERALAATAWTVRDLDAFAACTGPGSFTGLRIGLGLAKTMAFALGRPIVGVDALELAARHVAPLLEECDRAGFTVLCGGLRSDVYAAAFRRTAAGIERLLADRYFARPQLFAAHPASMGGRVFAPAHLAAALPGAVTYAPIPCGARLVAEIAIERLARGDLLPAASVQPHYLKPISIGGAAPLAGGPA